MNPALPLLLLLTGAGFLVYRLVDGARRDWALAWGLCGVAGILLLAPALAMPDGIPSPSGSLARFPPWQITGEPSGMPELGDMTFQVEPWLLFMRHELRAGRFPSWNPHQFSGAPFFSNGSSGVLFPLHLLFAALPLQLAFCLLPWLRVVIGGVGCFALARQLGLSRSGGLLAAIVYPLSGRLAAFLLFPMANALCLVPWLFLAAERISLGRREQGTGGFRLLALVGGLQLLAGHPETAVFTALLTGLYLLVRLGWRASVGRGGAPGGDVPASAVPPVASRLARLATSIAAAPFVRLAAGWAVAALLAAVALVPLALTLFATNRWQLFEVGPPPDLGQIAAVLTRFLLPDAFGHGAPGHAVGGDYWGPFPFVPSTLYAGALTLPLAVCGLARARRDRRWLALGVCLAFALASSLHLPGVRQLLLALPVIGKALHHYFLLAVELTLALAAGAGLDRWRAGRGRTALLAGCGLALAGLAIAWLLLADDWQGRGQLAHQAAWSAVLVTLLGGLLLSLRLPVQLRRRAAPLLLALAALDLAAAHAPSNPGLALDRLYPVTPAVERLAGAPGRLAAAGNVLRPNAAMVYGLYDVRGDDSLKLAHYDDLYAAELASPHPTFFRPIVRWDSVWLDRLGVRWAVLPPGAPPPPGTAGWRLELDGADARIYERPGALPLVRLAETAGEAIIEERRPGYWRIAWRAAGPGRLVIAESWDAGWRARLDRAHRVPVERHRQVLLAVDVGPGEGTVELSHLPAGIGWGAALSGLGILALVLATWRRRRGIG